MWQNNIAVINQKGRFIYLGLVDLYKDAILFYAILPLIFYICLNDWIFSLLVRLFPEAFYEIVLYYRVFDE